MRARVCVCVFVYFFQTKNKVKVQIAKQTLYAPWPLLLNCTTCPTCQTLTHAHPTPTRSFRWPDGWAFTNNFDINQHQSLEDRLSAARILVNKDPLCPVVVDDMSDTSAIKYGALPERLYVLQAGKVIYKVRGPSTRLPRV